MSDYIPEEILVGVLKLLPVKSLVQSRCVCKRWKQLIDSPYFVVNHLALQKPQFFVANVVYGLPRIFPLDTLTLPLFHTLLLPHSLKKSPDIYYFALMGTLHGIVCFYESHYMTSGIHLWNPSTRKLLNVPVPEYMHRYRYRDPKKFGYCCRTCSAFWIDPLTKHFKMVVVKMVHGYNEFEKYGAFYSSVEGDWKEISPGELESIADYLLYENDPGLVMGKVAYWRAFYYTPRVDGGYSRSRAIVLSYDFEHERFDSIEGPSVAFGSDPYLQNWQGSLSLVYLDPGKRCDLYSRQQGSWVNLFSISLPSYIRTVFCFLKGVGEMEENSKILLAETSEWKLVLFDTRGSCLTLGCGTTYMAHDFVESLVFP